MSRLPSIFLTALLLVAPGQAAEYTFVDPPAIHAEGLATLTLTAEEPIKVTGSLPDDARVRMLAHRSFRPDTNEPLHRLEIDILPLRPGSFELPPVPLSIGNDRLLFRCPPLVAEANSAPESISQLAVFWNGGPSPPDRLWQGQQVDVDILQISPRGFGRPKFLVPTLEIHGGRFRLHVKSGAQHNTPLAPIGTGAFGMGRAHSSLSSSEYKGEKVSVNRSKTFFTVASEATDISLQIASTVKSGEYPNRTQIFNKVIPVSPLPPLSDKHAKLLGLVGDWKVEGRLDPESPEPGEPFSIIIDFEGRGDPASFVEPDFSTPQFRSIQTELTEAEDSKIDYHRGTFIQRLLPIKDSAALPALSLATFDTVAGKWVSHPVTKGFGKVVDQAGSAVVADQLRAAVVRPLAMNFPRSLLLAATVAPLLPLLGLLLRRIRNHQQSPRRILMKRLRNLSIRREDQAETLNTSIIDDEMLPLLREYSGLPPGASATEVADVISSTHPELAEGIREHANSSFGSRSSSFRPPDFAALLGRLACFFLALLLLIPSPAAAQDSPALAEARRLVTAEPEQPSHQLRLARELMKDNQP
ncbi:hypothetical protein, partial [Haloferula sp.]|uniref:hypothetical protein n=1 Tax=Haloferula sp. TaxID=2497595 RepID=UPI003C758F0B